MTPLQTHPVVAALKVKGVTQVSGKPVAAWIAPILQYARAHGWKGSVTSGIPHVWRSRKRSTTQGFVLLLYRARRIMR